MKVNSLDTVNFVVEDAKTTLALGNAFGLDTDALLDAIQWLRGELEEAKEEIGELKEDAKRVEKEWLGDLDERDKFRTACKEALDILPPNNPAWKVLSVAWCGKEISDASQRKPRTRRKRVKS